MAADNLRDLFWKELREARTGMLATGHGREAPAQPMTAHIEGEDGVLWFFGRKDSELVRAAGGQAAFHYASRGHDIFALLHGDLKVSDDRAAIDRLWTDDVARWFPGGQSDPDLALLRFDADHGHLWKPTDGGDPHRLSFGEPEDVRQRVNL